MSKSNPDDMKGEEQTCQDILYNLRMGNINEYTGLRLVIERLDSLEEYVERLRTANNLRDK